MPLSCAAAIVLGGLILCCATVAGGAAAGPLRPPAVPLVTHDPYFSIWSPTDALTDSDTMHWTGAPHPLGCILRVDGRPFRLAGVAPQDVPAMPQQSVEVHPTRTVYRFEAAGVEVVWTFLTPALMHDLDVLARPVTYLTWAVRTTDGKQHAVQLGFDASALIAANTSDQTVDCTVATTGPLTILRAGTIEQPVLAKKGDNLRVDWGYLYLAAPTAALAGHAVMRPEDRRTLAETGRLPQAGVHETRTSPPDAASRVLAIAFDLGQVGARVVQRTALIAYDDVYSIEYFRTWLRPYWRRSGKDAEALLRDAYADHARLATACLRFDTELEADLTAAGGEAYRRIGVLAYRQALAGNKLAADAKGQPLLFPKENFSNGCIATVDVLYPMAPQFLLFSPTLTKAMLVPVLEYAASPRWKWPFAPHDLGTYPKANGQVYGGGERTEENQMPVEESGNLLILVAALARVEGRADFASRYWPQLTRWADYLRDKGFDPENQLCTDDFAGHLAHNVNLSAKAIMGLAAYGMLCEMRGDRQRAAEYRRLAETYAARWIREADDGDHFRLAFDRPGTCSQKYNLVWDRILGFGLFPDSVLRKETAWYRSVQNRYGLPLDNRKDYTKLDWLVWTASLAGERRGFDALILPVQDWLNETPSRVPLTDWYDTKSGRCVGFRARPVVGGVFVKLLYDAALWRKWAMRDRTDAGSWAPLPPLPVYRHVVPAADTADRPALWRYTFTDPAPNWYQPDFDDTTWSEGPAGFGREGTPGSVVRTRWHTRDIWLRRRFEWPEASTNEVRLWVHHDEDAEIYLNGVLAATLHGYAVEYADVPFHREALATLRRGTNTLAVHCHQTTGGQYVDVGLVVVEPSPR